MIGIILRQMEPISRVSHLQRCCQRRRSRWPNSQRIGGDDRMSYRKAKKQTDPLMRLDLNKADKFFVENGFHQDGQMQGRWMVKPRGTHVAYMVFKKTNMEISCISRPVSLQGKYPMIYGHWRGSSLQGNTFSIKKRKLALYHYKNLKSLTNQGTHSFPSSSTLEL